MMFTYRQLIKDALALAKKHSVWKRLESEGRMPCHISIPASCPRLNRKISSDRVWNIYGYATQPVNSTGDKDLDTNNGYVMLQMNDFGCSPIMLLYMRTADGFCVKSHGFESDDQSGSGQDSCDL